MAWTAKKGIQPHERFSHLHKWHTAMFAPSIWVSTDLKRKQCSFLLDVFRKKFEWTQWIPHDFPIETREEYTYFNLHKHHSRSHVLYSCHFIMQNHISAFSTLTLAGTIALLSVIRAYTCTVLCLTPVPTLPPTKLLHYKWHNCVLFTSCSTSTDTSCGKSCKLQPLQDVSNTDMNSCFASASHSGILEHEVCWLYASLTWTLCAFVLACWGPVC